MLVKIREIWAPDVDRLVKEVALNTPKASKSGGIIKKRPLWVDFLMLILSVVYLFPEIIFNAELVSVAGGKEPSDEALRLVELFGRTVSGIGASLLIADLVIAKTQSKLGVFVKFILVLACVWPTIFFGQKLAIDHFLVDSSSAESRQQAHFSQILRSSLAANTVEIEGIPYSPGKTLNAEEKTFLALFSGLVYADDAMLDSVQERKEEIARLFVKKKALDNFDQHFKDYKSLGNEIESRYKDYVAESKKYNKAFKPDKKAWSDMQSTVKSSWSSYQRAVKDFDRNIDRQAKKIAPELFDYFKRRDNCRTNRCKQDLKAHYDAKIKQMGLGPIKESYWLFEEDIGVAGQIKTGLVLALRNPGTFVEKWLGYVFGYGAGELDRKQLFYTNSGEHYKKLLTGKSLDKFKKKVGIQYGISSFKDFKRDRSVVKKIRQQMANKGIKLPKSWQLHHKKTFESAVVKKAVAEADKRWKEASDIPPNYSYKRFQLHPVVQNEIAEKMGEFYIKKMRVDMNNADFLKKVVNPNIDKQTDKIIKAVNAELPEFEDGGAREEEGKESLRATLVPPISMGLSLFLFLLTVAKIPGKVIHLMLGAQANKKILKHSIPVVTGLLMVSIVTLPPLVSSNELGESSTVNYFLEEIGKTSPFVEMALKWVMETQPLVHPVGEALNEMTGLTEWFEGEVLPELERVDVLSE